MENWTGIIKGTNRGLLNLQFEYIDKANVVGTFTLNDADAINVTAKIEGHREGNLIKAKLFDFQPKVQGVPAQGVADLTISENETKMEGTWQTDIGTKGECTLYRFSIDEKRPIIQEPAMTLETKDITIAYYSFDRKDIVELFKVMTGIAQSIRKGKESDCFPPIYTIVYDKEERIRTYTLDDFIHKLDGALKIWYVGFEFKNAKDIIQNIFINISYQEGYAPNLRSNVCVESTEKEITVVIPEMVRGFITKAKNKNIIWHHWILEAVVQLSGVIILTVFSFLISKKIAAVLPSEWKSGDTYILIVFIILLILSSNLWTYTSRFIYNYINRTFPIVEIISKSQKKVLSNIIFTVLVTLFSGATIYCLKLIVSFVKMLF